MKFLCCIKIVGDFDLGNGHVWEIVDNDVDLTFYPKQLNCFDASCVELVLRCKSECSQEISLTALTVSGCSNQRFLKPLYALGADLCVQIVDDRDLRFQPGTVAKEIADFVKTAPQDWLLFGSYQSIGQNGSTGILAASHLNLPCYGGITDFHVENDGLRITYRVDDAILTQTIHPPGVLILDETVATPLRTPTLKQRLDAGARTVELSTPKMLSARAVPDPVLRRLYLEQQENICEMMTADQLATQIYQQWGGCE